MGTLKMFVIRERKIEREIGKRREREEERERERKGGRKEVHVICK